MERCQVLLEFIYSSVTTTLEAAQSVAMFFFRATKKKKGLARVVQAGRDFAPKHLAYSCQSATPWYNDDTTRRGMEGLLLRTRGSQRGETESGSAFFRHPVGKSGDIWK